MTATSAPMGLVPIYHRNGGIIRAIPLIGGIASGYATSIFTGDPIIMNTSGNVVIAVASESAIDGVFQGCEYTDSTGTRRESPYWPASTVATNIIAYYLSDPNIVYEIQCAGSLVQTSLGDGTDIVLGTGNTKSGQSTSSLSSSLAGSGQTVQFKIVGLGLGVNNAWGDAYTIVQVISGIVSPAYAPGLSI